MIIIRLFFYILLVLMPVFSFAQGKVNRVKPPTNSVAYERTDAFGDTGVVARAVGSNGKWGAVDRNDKLIIPLKYGFLMPFYEGYAAAYKTKYGKAALIDSNGKELTDFIYDSMSGCQEGRICVSKDGKYGFLDTTGKVIIPLIYEWPNDYPQVFKDGKAKVIKDNEVFYIDRFGKRID